MAIINTNIDIEKCREEFLRTGSVFIRDFFIAEYAEVLYNFFNLNMPSDWWYSASALQNGVEYDRNYESDRSILLAKRAIANQRMYEGNFSYSFLRTINNHVEGCYCDECNLRKILISEEVLKFLSSISGEKIVNSNELFASKYEEGCFLSPHHDLKNGDIGFVLQLTKGWLPQWGGLLHFMTDDRSKVTTTEIPTFNTLTLFHLPDQSGKWHYVSHVNPGVKSSRIAYTGWFVKE
jgi:Rps23 Pro-64 3,4-dihydroxylase Tpa1-like proline 4-hydroxylase